MSLDSRPWTAWLVTRTNYVLETQLPYPATRLTLTWSKSFSGGLGWTVKPTVKSLLKQLGSNIDTPSGSNPLTVPVEIV